MFLLTFLYWIYVAPHFKMNGRLYFHLLHSLIWWPIGWSGSSGRWVWWTIKNPDLSGAGTRKTLTIRRISNPWGCLRFFRHPIRCANTTRLGVNHDRLPSDLSEKITSKNCLIVLHFFKLLAIL